MNKLKITLKMFMFISLTVMLSNSIYAYSGSGAGTKDDPYVITTAEELSEVRNSLSSYYILANDIDLNNVAFTPIGSAAAPFKGSFDGTNHVIRNLKVDVSDYAGLFGYINAGTVQNLQIDNIDVKSSGVYAGGISAFATNSTKFLNCSVIGSGGIVSNGASSIAGGINGYNSSATVIEKCYTTIPVTSKHTAGGILGNSNGDNCYIRECYSTGAVVGPSYAGGLVGFIFRSAYVVDSFTLSPVITNNAYGATYGGFYTNSYIAGPISSPNFLGFYNTPTNSYIDGINVGINNYAFSRLPSGLTNKSTFVNWDFNNIWNIDEGETYPYLKTLPKPQGIDVPIRNDVLSGYGTLDNPYIISTVEHLNNIRYDLRGYYKLANDIDLNNVAFTPIGTATAPFKGNFDGNGHVIKNLSINAGEYAGLFGYISGAIIQNVHFDNVEVISSGTYSGTVAAYALSSKIIKCSVTGSGSVVSNGASSIAGGINGYNATGTVIEKCYTTIPVTSKNTAGGILGRSNGDNCYIRECYSTGTVEGPTYAGGLVGFIFRSAYVVDSFTLSPILTNNAYGATYGGVYTNSYIAGSITSPNFLGFYNTPTNSYIDGINVGINNYAFSRLPSGLTNKSTFINWDFNNIWNIDEGESYPYLRSLPKPQSLLPVRNDVLRGYGTIDEPYIISTVEQFNNIRYDLRGYYKLANDIDLNNVAFTPIGTAPAPFKGNFDGDGYIIRNLKVDVSDYAGLFGYISGATIQNLQFENVDIKSSGIYSGTVVAYADSSKIIKCSVTGSGSVVSNGATGIAGGINGYNENATVIEKCYTTIPVTSKYMTGGILGKSEGSNCYVRECYSTGAVEGLSYAGGLVGYVTRSNYVINSFTLSPVTTNGVYGISGGNFYQNSYIAGNITSPKTLVGFVNTPTNAYYDSDIITIPTQPNYGRTTQQLMSKATFANWDFNTIWNIDEGKTYPYLRALPKPESFNYPVDIPVSGITISDTSKTLKENNTYMFTVTITPNDATNKNLTWTSDNELVATVDPDGNVTAVKPGNAVITVTTVDGTFTATCNITVISSLIEADGITLNKNSQTINLNDSIQLVAIVTPSDASDKTITWSSSDEAVATVDNNGNVTGVGEGNALITATTHNGLTASCNISVENATSIYKVNDYDQSVKFVGNWIGNTYPSLNYYLNDLHYGNDLNGYVEFEFEGTSVKFITSKDSNLGIADIYLDGDLLASVDLYAPTEEYQVEVFNLPILTNGKHTIRVAVSGNKNPLSSGNYITVDAFEYEGINGSNEEEDDDDVNFNGIIVNDFDSEVLFSSNTWIGNTYPGLGYYNNDLHYSNNVNDFAEFEFSGNSIKYIGTKDSNLGIADIYIDGVKVKSVDLYAPTEQVQEVIFIKTGLSDGLHEIKVVVSGAKNPNASNTYITVDAFEYQ